MTEPGLIAGAAHLAGGTLTAAVFGGMVFFAFVYAPLVFTKLPAAQAGAFIRAVFPVYYSDGRRGARGRGAAPAQRRGVRHDRHGRGVFCGAAAADAADQRRPRRVPRRRSGNDGTGGQNVQPPARLSVMINFVQMLAVLIVLLRLLAGS